MGNGLIDALVHRAEKKARATFHQAIPVGFLNEEPDERFDTPVAELLSLGEGWSIVDQPPFAFAVAPRGDDGLRVVHYLPFEAPDSEGGMVQLANWIRYELKPAGPVGDVQGVCKELCSLNAERLYDCVCTCARAVELNWFGDGPERAIDAAEEEYGALPSKVREKLVECLQNKMPLAGSGEGKGEFPGLTRMGEGIYVDGIKHGWLVRAMLARSDGEQDVDKLKAVATGDKKQ